jgi:hypothetical protein
LFTYGILLFMDNPLGYGYAFTPTDHWTRFWQYLAYDANPTGVTVADLHNYPLSMLNTYGLGIVLTTPLVIALMKRAQRSVIFFIPYIVHIMFHNSGPFWNDIPFWFVIGALSASPTQTERRIGPTASGPKRVSATRAMVSRRLADRSSMQPGGPGARWRSR